MPSDVPLDAILGTPSINTNLGYLSEKHCSCCTAYPAHQSLRISFGPLT